MNLLYIGYWSILDGLSEATIKPHLKALSSLDTVSSITYVSIEREQPTVNFEWNISKVHHLPHYSPQKNFLLDKLVDFTILPKKLRKICTERVIDKIICRSSPAGALGYLIWKKTKIPYYVESFEPHAYYMLESGVWKIWYIRFWLQKYFEDKLKSTSSGLMPVSEAYKKHLLRTDNVNCPVEVAPCTVNREDFSFDETQRKEIRKKLDIPASAIVGIYVGKFGGIYYDKEAFMAFKTLQEANKKFFLIILTPHEKDYIKKRLIKISYSLEHCWYDKVPHNHVPSYLSAADFAFSLHKTTTRSIALSPIKNGEYWANGLPIVIGKQIGDDSYLIDKFKNGLLVNYKKGLEKNIFENIKQMIKRNGQNRFENKSTFLAQSYRNENISKIYESFLLQKSI